MTKTISAGIVIDAWKLPIFDRHLSDAGYTYTKHPGPSLGFTADTLLLKVACESAVALEPIVRSANAAAAAEGKPSE
jgi:hypothetical protein